MTARAILRRLLSTVAGLAPAVAGVAGLPGAAPAATSLPCDIYGAAGTPCVGAHSTVRALYAAYNGPLYQIQRVSDAATTDVGLLSAGGYANASTQDGFCAGTTCVITVIYDQSARHNDLTVEGPGTAGGQDVGADAAALPVTAGGHRVFGVYIAGHTGYRHRVGAGVAVNGQPEGISMVAGGTHVNGQWCFDYGNAEATIADTGNGHMDAVYLGLHCHDAPCTGSGPWVAADLENGLYQGSGNNPANLGNPTPFVTALLKNDEQARFALKGGNATSGGLSTWWNGALPAGGDTPIHQEGSIVLGTGGDNSNGSVGSCFEGVMTAGYPTDAADAAANGTKVQLWDCAGAGGPVWQQAGTSLKNPQSGRCLDAPSGATANGTRLQIWDCNGSAAQTFTLS